MAYIRIKDVTKTNGKRYTYAYLVKSTWRKRKAPKQKTLKYLGKLYTPKIIENRLICINHNHSKEELYRELVRIELLNHGYKEKREGVLQHEDCYVDLKRLLFYNKEGKEIVLQTNRGFLCNHSIQRLIDYTHGKDKKTQRQFAKMLELSGLDLEPEEFVELYEYLNNG